MPRKASSEPPRGSRQLIGVFDSGVGGLSVLRALEKKLPHENYIYFGDTARAPYGGRSPDEIRKFCLEIGSWLLAFGCKMLVIACNTLTVRGISALEEISAVPVYGMMEAILAGLPQQEKDPYMDPALEEMWPVGFIATQSTIESGEYQRALMERAPGKSFYVQACPRFTPLVERGLLVGSEVSRAVEETLSPLHEKGIRTLILGCTHYPFLAPAISAYMGSCVKLVDPALPLASIVGEKLQKEGLLHDSDGDSRSTCVYWCSGDTAAFKAVGSALLGHTLEDVRKQVF
ncbi:MAG: glutamate racemase [Peptococcaceae bacterium]|jgi:glutamate racemase|nr:glutamate racemase [Peptococcaceae bacterium]